MTIKLRSPVFASGENIPKRYTGEGDDISPPLQWSETPAGTKQFALICVDPDAPTDDPWVHWLLYGIPPDVTGLPEGLPAVPVLNEPPGAAQGKNSWSADRTIGYRGPMPPPGHGVHHYYFTIYALDKVFDLQPELGKRTLMSVMNGHILDQGELMGTYER
jgi:Raf kinase inhibitor-like YbhB/YbcL family protein